MSFTELFGGQRIIDGWLSDLERFAALVAAAEREKLKSLYDQIRFDEREECAKIAGVALLGADKALSDRVIKAIRARGEK